MIVSQAIQIHQGKLPLITFALVCFEVFKVNPCLGGKGGDLEELLPQYEACIFMFGVVI